MIPKRGVNVMSGEIDRLLVLTQNAIIPIGFHVQRRVRLIGMRSVYTVAIL